jgi:hypothetical protein
VLALASIRETHQSTTPDFPSLPGGFLFIDVATGSSFRVRYVSSGSLLWPFIIRLLQANTKMDMLLDCDFNSGL